jgi:hypothetical protein
MDIETAGMRRTAAIWAGPSIGSLQLGLLLLASAIFLIAIILHRILRWVLIGLSIKLAPFNIPIVGR